MHLKDFIALDMNAKYYGIDPFQLMENAGKSAAEELSKLNGKFLFVCGSGNNGGDGFVSARELHQRGREVKVFCVSEPKALEARRAFRLLPEECLCPELELKSCDVIVDCMLGVGVEGEPREPYASLIERINSSKKRVVSMDLPSGFGSKKAVNPDLTITFHKMKDGLDKEKTIVRDINIPEDIENLCGPGDVKAFFPRNRKDSHKGENGRVAVVGGGPYTGAPMISALAALRSGADLVYLCVPEKIYAIESSFEPSLIVRRIDDIPEADSILIGPGLGEDELSVAEKILDSALQANKKVVCDATIFRALPQRLSAKCIITPHLGEFKAIGGRERSEEEVKRVAAEKGCTVLLKGSTDIISDGERLKRNPSGHPSMTKGGTGDALSGLCAGLYSRMSDPLECACMAAYINGRCGEIGFKRSSYGYTTTELVNIMPEVIKGCLE